MKIRPYIAVLLLTLCSFATTYAQESEADLNEKALALFAEEKYEEAGKIYSTLLSINLQNPEYNYRFGACQLLTIPDKEEALKYLKFATEQGDFPSLAYFYYGYGLHLNYRFDKAITQYEKYKPEASKKDKESALVDRFIQQCKDGKTLVSSFTDISVVQRSVLPRTEFHRNYDLAEFGGKIIVKPEDFMSEEDKKRDAKFLMYFQQSSDLIYYASYSEKNTTGKDLYFIQKLPTGGWSEPSKLPNTINTDFDEDYPFIHPEGSTLYFASKGHNSMGGYDIFKTERRGDGTWTPPVNMEFAINTPWDDFMFITDLEESSAWFASNRETSNTQVTVYRIGMERIPLDLTLIKGVFEFDDGSRKAKITVEDMAQNKTVGVYTSDRQFGDYLLDLKGSGQYKFLVEAEESDAIHSGIVEVPREKGLKQFRQEMRLVMVDGQEQLQIINHFDDPIEDEQLLTADILKKQASLSVNASEDDLERTVSIIDDGSGGSLEDPLGAPADAPRDTKVMLAQRAVRELEGETKMMNAKASTLYDLSQQTKDAPEPEAFAQSAIAAELAAAFRKEAEKREVAIERMNMTLNLLEGEGLEDAAFNAQYNQLAATANNFQPTKKFQSDLEKNFEKRLNPTISEYESKRAEVEDFEESIAAIDDEVAYYQQEIENTKDDAIKEELQLQIDEASASKPQKEAALDRATTELTALIEMKNNAANYAQITGELLRLADAYADPNLVKVDMRSLGQLQDELTERAKDDPALLAVIDPDEADLALEESLQESRKEAGVIEGSTGSNSNSNSSSSSGSDSGTDTSSGDVASTDGSQDGSPTSTEDTPTDINEQIEAISATESQPEIVQGDYDSYFIDEIETAGNAEDPIIAESRKAELYDSWAENIGARIDSLQEAKLAETEGPKLVEIDDELNALEAEKAEKEDLAMASYQRIADLSDQAAAGGGIADVPTDNRTTQPDGSSDSSNPATSGSPVASDELPPSAVAVNEAFEARIEELPEITINSSSDEKIQLAEVYESWSDSLAGELAVLGEQILAAESIEDRNKLEATASELNDFRKQIEDKATELYASVDNEAMQAEVNESRGSLQGQLYEYIENYDASAFQQIEEQILSNPNETVRQAELETLNKSWMIALQNEKVKTKARIENTNDPAQKEDLEAKLADLNAQNERVQNVLDSLAPSAEIAGPSAPSSVMVNGSERFEGYVPVENTTSEVYQSKAGEKTKSASDLEPQVTALEETLAETKKKKKRREIEAELDNKEGQLKTLQMESAFYAQADQQLAAVETQVLTMEAGDPLPSEAQQQNADALKTEADQMFVNAQTAQADAEGIRKKKERLPALREAEKMRTEARIKQQEAALAQDLADEMRGIEEATIQQNYIILPGQEVVLPVSNRTLNPNEKEDVRFTVEFLDYDEQKTLADSIRQEVAKMQQMERQFTSRGTDLLDRSATAPLESADGNSRIALADQAYEDFERADSLSKMIAQLTRQATFIENEANRQLLSRPEEVYMNVLAYYNDEPERRTDVADVTLPPIDDGTQSEPTDQRVDPLNQGDAFRLNAPVEEDNSRLQVDMDVLTQTIFELEDDPQTSTSLYSAANPIPVDPPLPTGLMYKVQIGAFRNPIQQDAFKGISPIIGESTPQGFTRYSAGEFNNFGQADAAKTRIQGIGYSDAFVVAYLNGVRIGISQARAIEGGASPDIATPIASAGGTATTRPSVQTQFIQQGALEIQAVENIAGTFFTVQVGVYSNPVTSADIYNITPLMQENLPNGLYRYTTGKFDNETVALNARDEARAIGVADAFVTAYRDGVRVTVDDARGSATPQPRPQVQLQPQPQAGGQFRILLGTYMGDVPAREASQILLLSGEGVDKISNNDGSSSYYYGSFGSQAEADARAQELRNQGLTQAQSQRL